jgi:hypothetical protein
MSRIDSKSMLIGALLVLAVMLLMGQGRASGEVGRYQIVAQGATARHYAIMDTTTGEAQSFVASEGDYFQFDR